MKTKQAMKPLTEDQARRKFRDGVRGSKEKMRYILDNRSWLPASSFMETVQWLSRESFSKYVFHDAFPQQIEVIGAYASYAPISFKREIAWATAILACYHTQLNEYIRLKNKFEIAFLMGDEVDSFRYLEEIKCKLGYSIWLLKHEVAVKQHFQGIESQKDYTKEIKDRFGARSVYSYLFHNISILNEGTISTASLMSEVRNDLSIMDLPAEWKIVIQNYWAPDAFASTDEALTAVRYSYSHSIIDLYETIITLAKVAFVQKASSEVITLVVNLVQSISSSVNDNRLSSLLFLLSDGKYLRPFKFDTVNYKAYLDGNTSDIKHIEKQLFQSGDVGNYLVASRIMEFEDDTKIVAKQLCNHFRRILSNDADCELSISHLDKYAYALSGIELFQRLSTFAKREFSDYPVGIYVLPSDLSDLQKKIEFSTAGYISSHPLTFPYLSPDHFSILLKAAITSGEFETPTFPYIAMSPNDSDQYLGENRLINCLNNINKNLPIDSEILRTLTEIPIKFFEKSAFRLHLFSLIKEDEIEQALDVCTLQYIKNPTSINIMPIQDLADALNRTRRKEMRKNISLPILFDIYSRNIDGAYESVLRPSVTGVLVGHNVKRPSQLEAKEHLFNKAKLIYFLSFTCLPDVIYMAGGYASTEDLLDERVKILRWLSKLDEENQAVYQENIIDVTRQIVLNARRAEVEQNKIELNVEGFCRASEKKLREKYIRYKSLFHAGINNREQQRIPSQNNSSTNVAIIPKVLPENEVSSLFDSMVADLLNVFIKDKNYGLDGFLSTRIRHNVLEGELRSPLEKARLVTQKDERGSYRFNDYWLRNYHYNEGVDAQVLNDLLTNFTRSYDSLITEINDKWIRIRLQDAPDAMINIALDKSEYNSLRTIVNSKDFSSDHFARVCFLLFSQKLESELTELRQKVDSELKDRAILLLDELERDIQKQCSFAGLVNAIREMRVEIPRAVDRVVSWLKPTYEVSTEPLQFSDVLQISIEIAQRFNPRFKANICLNETSTKLIQGVVVPIYSDIFVIIFHNVLIHAKLDNPLLNINATIKDGDIRISFTNKLGSEVDRNRLKARIEETNFRLKDGTYLEFLRGKSGTGLCRIYSMIKDGLHSEPEMSVELLKNENDFQLQFNLPFEFVNIHADDSSFS